MRHPFYSEEDEEAIRQRIQSAAKSRVHGYPPETLRQLLDDARTLRSLLDWERHNSRAEIEQLRRAMKFALEQIEEGQLESAVAQTIRTALEALGDAR
jgi:DNA-binding transcriptional MerR regulator